MACSKGFNPPNDTQGYTEGTLRGDWLQWRAQKGFNPTGDGWERDIILARYPWVTVPFDVNILGYLLNPLTNEIDQGFRIFCQDSFQVSFSQTALHNNCRAMQCPSQASVTIAVQCLERYDQSNHYKIQEWCVAKIKGTLCL